MFLKSISIFCALLAFSFVANASYANSSSSGEIEFKAADDWVGFGKKEEKPQFRSQGYEIMNVPTTKDSGSVKLIEPPKEPLKPRRKTRDEKLNEKRLEIQQQQFEARQKAQDEKKVKSRGQSMFNSLGIRKNAEEKKRARERSQEKREYNDFR